MTPEHWQQIDDLFQRAVERPAEERAALLAEACAGQESLRQEVESLIRFSEMAGSFLEVPALEAAASLFYESQAESMAGRLIGPYRIESPLGAGGMGVVYLAHDTKLDRKVAIKFLPVDLEADELAKRQLIREAKAAAKLDHPNICAIYEIGEEAGLSYIVMQYVAGKTLASKIKEKPLALGESLDVTVQVADALVEAHSHGVIHRDIKPQNIMLTHRGQVKVLDFGLAKLTEKVGATQSETQAQSLFSTPGVIVGTAPYMSPEQAAGVSVDSRSDLFSLGVILYECVAGGLPFVGDGQSEIREQVIRFHPPPPSKLNPHVPPELDAMTLKALAKDPDARYQSAGDFLEDLRAVRAAPLTEDRVSTKSIPLTTRKPSAPALTNLSYSLRRPRVFIPAILLALTVALPTFWIILPELRIAPHHPPREAMFWYDAGANGLRNGAYYEASKALQQAVAIDDEFALAHARLAEAYAELDYADKANHEILRARSLVRDLSPLPELDGLYLQAVTHVVLRELPPAIESYKEITRQAPEAEKAHAYVDLGRAFEKNEETEKAIESYQEATKLAPSDAAAFLRLGILYGREQNLGPAQEAFQRAEALYQAISNFEGVTEVFYQRGFLFLNLVKLRDARAQLETALDMTKTTANKYQQIRTLLALSDISVDEGHTMQAEQQATQAIELARANGIENQATNGLIWLGNAFLLRGDYGNAEKYYQQALQLAQRDKMRLNEALALLQLGSLRSLQHNTDEAVRYIQQSLPFLQQGGYRKWLSIALTLLGRTYRDKGDYEAALKAFTDQLQLSEQLGDLSQVALSHVEIGNVLSTKEQYMEALQHYEESYKMFKSLDADIYVGYAVNDKASVLWQIGRYEEARAALAEASSIAKRPEGTYKQLLADIYQISAFLELSDWHLRESEVKSHEALNLAGTQYADVAVQAKYTLGLAQARSGAARAGRRLCEEAVEQATRTGDPQLFSGALLASAEATLESGEAQRALDTALRAQESFERFGKQESEWRAWLIAGRASQRLGKELAARDYASNAFARLSNLEQTSGPEAYNGYLTRLDIQHSRKQLDQLLNP